MTLDERLAAAYIKFTNDKHDEMADVMLACRELVKAAQRMCRTPNEVNSLEIRRLLREERF